MPSYVLNEAQRALAEQFMPLAYKLASRNAYRRGCTYEEALSDAFYRLVCAAAKYRPELGASFLTFAWSYILPPMRRSRSTVQLSQLSERDREWSEPAVTDQAPPDEVREERDSLHATLCQILPAKSLAVLLRHFVEEQSIEEIAHDLRLPWDRVNLRLSNAVKLARKALAADRPGRPARPRSAAADGRHVRPADRAEVRTLALSTS